ncbi:MAG: DUF6682 family protein [Schleiferiaceae bacterium]
MSFTVADIVVETRELLLDESEPYRYSDEFIIRKVNQVLRRMVIVRPDLFAAIDTITTVPGSLQSCPADSVRLMDVAVNGVGYTPKEINQEVLDLMFPRWNTDATGATINWMRYPRDPNRFYVYPPAAGGEQLTIVYAKSPPVYGATDVVGLQDAYQPVLLDGVCWLMESIDAEHVESGRAKMFQDAYNNALGAGLAARVITDTDDAGASASRGAR